MTPRPLRLGPARFDRLRKRFATALSLAEVETLIAEAKAQAISAAAGDATNKANAVKTDAATDATNKATAARDAAMAAIPPFATGTPEAISQARSSEAKGSACFRPSA